MAFPIPHIRPRRAPMAALRARLRGHIPADRLRNDPLSLLAHAGDASCYRLIPKLVVIAASEGEIVAVLEVCHGLGIPVTFRAAGTSLSGQALSDSVLLVIARSFNRCEVLDGGLRIRMQPALIGAAANRALASYGRKLGPDPASLDAAMVGGIAANNASGMCCGTAQNCYRTLDSMRLVLADGSVLDTADADSRSAFARSHAGLLEGLARLASEAQADAVLRDRITRKYRIKNTVGYGLNSLIDFSDPMEILQHLLIGSEGTLACISSLTLRTVRDPRCKAAVLARFADGDAAAAAVRALASAPAQAVEYMDAVSLRCVAGRPGMGDLDPGEGPALLIDVGAENEATLDRDLVYVQSRLRGFSTAPLRIARSPGDYRALWAIRKGLFPAIGALRPPGTAIIIEDVAFPVERLGEALSDLRALLDGRGYPEAIIYGHALAGNLHFVFWHDFADPEATARYAAFMEALVDLIVGKYAGSLKAEHGTGRNMAPFVEREWGADAYAMMRRIKDLFDPKGILNPDVILSGDPRLHLKHLKPMPKADAIVDACMECGFCETVCPSRDVTLTPRQRIAVHREITRLESAVQSRDVKTPLRALREGFRHAGMATCATDGLCAAKCPVGIDTGALVKTLRHREHRAWQDSLASLAADRFGLCLRFLRLALTANQAARMRFGERRWSRFLRGCSLIFPRLVPGGLEYLPRPAPAAGKTRRPGADISGDKPKVLYFSACLNRAFGQERADDPALDVAMVELLQRAGYAVAVPRKLAGLCCGLAFASKGFVAQGERKTQELRTALAEQARDCVAAICDASPCTQRIRETAVPGLRVYDAAEFLATQVLPKLTVVRRNYAIAIHPPCSAVKMGLTESLRELASACASSVHMPAEASCCGVAGDRLFTHPELPRSALAGLRAALPADCREGYAGSRACEIGLTRFGGIPYRSLAYLLLECSRVPSPSLQPKETV